jgi:hypothetical protein
MREYGIGVEKVSRVCFIGVIYGPRKGWAGLREVIKTTQPHRTRVGAQRAAEQDGLSYAESTDW